MHPNDTADTIEVRFTRAQALAAGAVLRGYVQHQRERLGDRAATNPNFQNVAAALRAIEAQAGPPDAGTEDLNPRR